MSVDQSLKEMKSIVPAGTAIQTFRDAGYKNTASALAELIDNSIEADAENIQVLTFEEEVFNAKRATSRISEIVVYDDGIGMDPNVLSVCLQFGNGTRLASRKGIGRFGIGLPNASISQCRRVEVYSWQNNKCFHTYLDVDEVRENSQQTVNPVLECKFPEDYLSQIEGGRKDSGTLIVWRKCDRLDIAKSRTLFRRMEQGLCRVYRHFLDSDNEYGTQRKIKLISCGNEREITQLKANDPLYLMTPNTVPGHENVSTNVMHGKVIRVELPYNEKGDKGTIEIRFSIALPETQALGGNSAVGKHYRDNTGISFVRAAREIDFGTFGYFNPQDERQRWWGCEVRFSPVFDEIFGVTNNKQSVRGAHYLSIKEFKDDHPNDWEEVINEDLRLSLRRELSKIIENNIKQLNEIITTRGKGTRGGTAQEKALPDKSTRIANEDLLQNKAPTSSKLQGETKSKEQKIDEWTRALLESDTSLSEEDAKSVAERKIDLIVDKSFGDWPGSQFFSVETTGATCNLVINRKHPFFTELYDPLLQVDEHRYIDALDLMLMAYARMQDELYDRIEDIEDINSTWGTHLRNFLRKLNSDA